jgi:hypothetical protein
MKDCGLPYKKAQAELESAQASFRRSDIDLADVNKSSREK